MRTRWTQAVAAWRRRRPPSRQTLLTASVTLAQAGWMLTVPWARTGAIGQAFAGLGVDPDLLAAVLGLAAGGDLVLGAVRGPLLVRAGLYLPMFLGWAFLCVAAMGGSPPFFSVPALGLALVATGLSFLDLVGRAVAPGGQPEHDT